MAATAADKPGRSLFQTERQNEIAALALQNGRVDVTELATIFGVTNETIRRDLSELQGKRLVRRVHGGAVPWQTGGFEPLLAVRNDLHVKEKRRIARMALQELPATGTIIIDSGSTLTLFAECLPGDRELQVVTNSLLTAQTLATNAKTEVIVLGGGLRKDTFAMVDSQTVAAVNDLQADTLFISSDGMALGRGLTTPYREEAALKQAMIASVERVVALVDFSKMNMNHLVRFAAWSSIDVLITDDRADDETVAALESLVPLVLRA